MTANEPEVVGFATHHDEPMMFPNRKEAAAYCDDREDPVALIRLSDYEALQAECESLNRALTESRANDQQAMAYLNEVRAIVGADDFPDMVRRCEKLRKDAGTERQIQRAAQHLPEGWRIIVEVERDAGWIDAFNPDGRRIEIDWVGSLAEQIEQAIDAAMQDASHD